MVKIQCQFSGGLQVLFGNQYKMEVTLEGNPDIGQLIDYLTQNHLTKKKDMFIVNNSQL